MMFRVIAFDVNEIRIFFLAYVGMHSASRTGARVCFESSA